MLLGNVLLERWIQLMSGGFETVNLAWIKKIAVNGYMWLFVYRRAFNYEEGMHEHQAYIQAGLSRERYKPFLSVISNSLQ